MGYFVIYYLGGCVIIIAMIIFTLVLSTLKNKHPNGRNNDISKNDIAFWNYNLYFYDIH